VKTHHFEFDIATVKIELNDGDTPILQYELAKILKNESIIISVASENSNSQLVILEYKISEGESLQISKIKPLDIQLGNIKSLTVVNKFNKQNENMIMLVIVNQKGLIMGIRMASSTYRIFLPGQEADIGDEATLGGKLIILRIW
jgi:hypothetical protein